MIQFEKPQNLNGAELLAELNAGGVTITDSPVIDGNNNLLLNVKPADKIKAETIVSAHNGTIIAPELTLDKKLAMVGLSVPDLKAALGL